MKFSKYLLNEFCKITTIHQNKTVFLFTYVSLWTFGGNSVLLFWQACPIRQFTIWNRWKPGRLQYICYKHINTLSPDRQLQLRNSKPPVTLLSVTAAIVNTVSWHCYSIQLQIASSDLVNYITVKVGSYSCPCAPHGDIYVAWSYSSTHS